MKVLLIAEFFLSGQSTHVLDLANSLVRLGHRVEVVFTKIHYARFHPTYGALLEQHGVGYHHTANLADLKNIIRQFWPTIIHCHSSTMLDITQTLAKLAGCPYVVTCHGLGLERRKYRQGLDGAARLIAVGRRTAHRLVPRYGNKLDVIPNGIDIDTFFPRTKEANLRIYYVGRITPSKKDALAALNQAVANIPQLELVIVGRRRSPLSGVECYPWQTDLAALLGTANIVVGSGRSAREGMAAGCAVLLMNRTYDGILTPELTAKATFDFWGSADWCSFSQLEEDLRQLLAIPGLLLDLQAFGRSYAVQNLSSKQMVLRTLKVYRKALWGTLNRGKHAVLIDYHLSAWALKQGLNAKIGYSCARSQEKTADPIDLRFYSL